MNTEQLKHAEAIDGAHADARTFDDLKLGQRFHTEPISVSEASIIKFGTQFDPQPIHCDPLRAHDSMFGGLIASGWQTGALTMKLLVEARLLGSAYLIGVEVDRIRFVHPLRPGDDIYAEAMVIQKRPARNPGKGYVSFAITTSRVDGQVLMTQQWTLLVPRRTRGDGAT